MSIQINEKALIFQLNSRNSSYCMGITKGYLSHIYWGRPIDDPNVANHSYMSRVTYRTSFNANDSDGEYGFSLDTQRLEFPSFGRGDMRTPAFEIENADGSVIADLKYHSHKIYQGKPPINNLPGVYSDSKNQAETLEIILHDKVSNIFVSLFYSVFHNLDVISRHVVVRNCGNSDVKIKKIMSASLDFDNSKYELISNNGAWGRERMIERVPLFNGLQEIYSARGSSSHSHNPFFVMVDKNTTENQGDAYGFSLVYSGSFEALVDVDSFSQARAMIGINHNGFSWIVSPNEEFSSPEANLIYSPCGIGQMSRNYHKLYRNNLCRGKHKNSPRPVLINTWEACYFNFNEEKVAAIAKEASALGIELVVVDDGWFGKRDDDTTSLGDWFEDMTKLPHGIEGLSKCINDAGCAFGIWFEPEMINPVSELYKFHPDWVLKISNRPSSLARKQLVLDMGNKNVQAYLFERISDIIKRGNISYIKWDFNRNLTEVGSSTLDYAHQGETSHRYVLGLYALLERLVTTFPDVLFESCSGGGGRFDPGMLYYMPQTWTSDNTDAIKRLKIQYGTSLIYPLSSMSAHISACPNHQTGTISPIKTRKNVALTGSFGFELNPIILTDEEKQEVINAVNMYKQLGSLLVCGDYYRLASPYDTNNSGWMFVAEDKSQAFVVVVNSVCDVNDALQRIQLYGLLENGVYKDQYTGETYTQKQLENFGLCINQFIADKDSQCWNLVLQK